MCHVISFFYSPVSTSHAKVGKVYNLSLPSVKNSYNHIYQMISFRSPKLDWLEDKTYQKTWKAIKTPNPKSAY